MGEFQELTMSTVCACGTPWHTKTLIPSARTTNLRRFKTCPVCLSEPEGEVDTAVDGAGVGD